MATLFLKDMLKEKIRDVTEKDKDLPVMSYSKLEVFKNCHLQYKFKYEDLLYTNDTSLALELGTLCHYVLEQKGKMLVANKTVDYEKLTEILQNGVTETDEKTKEKILGVKELRKKYFDEWWEPDNASGMTYEQKMNIYDTVLLKEMTDTDWIPTYFEMPFNFVWDNKVIFRGFIDRIDTKNGQYRTVDYKTSKKIYDKSKLSTSLQFGIYALAILNKFDAIPVESLYRFILLDDEQQALTKGWEKRLVKALDKIFNDIDTCQEQEIWMPSPTPLCHWCNYCKHNENAKQYGDLCEYYSLWTPNNKTFEKNKEWSPTDNKTETRKLIF